MKIYLLNRLTKIDSILAEETERLRYSNGRNTTRGRVANILHGMNVFWRLISQVNARVEELANSLGAIVSSQVPLERALQTLFSLLGGWV